MIFDKQPEFHRPVVKPYRRFSLSRFAEIVWNALIQLAKGVAILVYIALAIFGDGGAANLPSTRKEFGMLLVLLLVVEISIVVVAHYR
ncbi:hypothetical protein ACIPF8_09925 [Collimonas sp. NPDC087041]|uniref:hypothetical protein n=1 Tax=Collimonas sp. NPDC087041 TaxID=3363960 RepID=UPI003806B0CE